MRHVVFLLALCACPPNLDAEAQQLVDDLQALDDGATDTMRVSPNETGLGNVELLVRTKSLHERVLRLQPANLSAPKATALTNACTKNVTAAHNVEDYVKNAMPKASPTVRARAKKLAAQICEICETPSFATECAPFRTPATE